jgi:hypothetical protein
MATRLVSQPQRTEARDDRPPASVTSLRAVVAMLGARGC